MTRTSLICVGLAILILGIDGGRVIRSPQFSQANAQASAQAGAFGPPPPPAQFGPGFGRGNFGRPHRFEGGSGPLNPGFGGGSGFGNGGSTSISISKSISISQGGTAQSNAGSSASGK